jgi:hypothetical protein
VYDEVFTVTLSLYHQDNVGNGPLTVTLGENEHFEIIGDKQYIVEDYTPRTKGSPYYRGGEKYVQDFTFTLRAISAAPYLDSLNFYVDYTLVEWGSKEPEKYPYGEYADGHTVCYRIHFMNDKNGVMLAPDSIDDFYDWTSDVKLDLLIKCADRRFVNGELTAYELIAMHRSYSSEAVRCGSANIDTEFKKGVLKRINYTSYCFTAQIEISEEFLLSDDYLVLIDLLRRNDTESQVACAKMVIDMVRDATELSDERYEAALAVLENKKITKKVLSTKYSFIEKKLAIQNISKYFYEFKINV